MSPNGVTDFNVMVAGQGGDGSLTVVTLVDRLMRRHGLHLYTSRNVASRIKGGHAAALLRGSDVRRGCIGDHLDLLVAFDAEALEIAGPRVGPEGIIVFDSSHGEPRTEVAIDPTVQRLDIPFGRLSVRDLRRDLFKNSFGFGVVTRLLSVPDDEAEDVLSERFNRLPPRAKAANIEALRRGFEYAEEHGIEQGQGRWRFGRAQAHGEHILASGNQGAAFGFLAAGGRFFTGYPITPATDVLDYLGPRINKLGGVVVQAEDEMSSINMALGASMAGVRAMTASSGPGIALMQETIGHLGSAEIPLVIIDAMRAGPSTGMPTKPEQSDLDMLVFGGNGDFPRIVLAPTNPYDAFEIGVIATNVAQLYQGPVFIAMDQAIAQDSVTVRRFDVDSVEVEPGKVVDAETLSGLEEYRRYAVTADGISPWATPGTKGGLSLVTGNERDEWGLVSTEPDNRVEQMDKRERKVKTVESLLPAALRGGDPDAEIGIVGIGMEVGVIIEAVERLAKSGSSYATFMPRTIWPVPDETIEFISSRRIVYVVEHNAEGQLKRVLAAAGAPPDRMHSILRYDGVPFRPADLVAALSERASVA